MRAPLARESALSRDRDENRIKSPPDYADLSTLGKHRIIYRRLRECARARSVGAGHVDRVTVGHVVAGAVAQSSHWAKAMRGGRDGSGFAFWRKRRCGGFETWLRDSVVCDLGAIGA